MARGTCAACGSDFILEPQQKEGLAILGADFPAECVALVCGDCEQTMRADNERRDKRRELN